MALGSKAPPTMGTGTAICTTTGAGVVACTLTGLVGELTATLAAVGVLMVIIFFILYECYSNLLKAFVYGYFYDKISFFLDNCCL